MLHIKRSSPDGCPMSVRALTYCVATLMLNCAHERRVFVHCRRGSGRAALVAAAYLCLAHGLTLKDADAHLRTCHENLSVASNAHWNLLNDFLLRFWNSPQGYAIRKQVIDTFNAAFARQAQQSQQSQFDSYNNSMSIRTSRTFSSRDLFAENSTRRDSESQVGSETGSLASSDAFEDDSMRLKPYRNSVSVTFTPQERERLRNMGFTEDEYPAAKLGDEYDDEEVDPEAYAPEDNQDPEYYEGDDEDDVIPPPPPEPDEWPDDEVPAPPPLTNFTNRVDYSLGNQLEEDTTHYFPIFGSLFKRPAASRLSDASISTRPILSDADAPPVAQGATDLPDVLPPPPPPPAGSADDENDVPPPPPSLPLPQPPVSSIVDDQEEIPPPPPALTAVFEQPIEQKLEDDDAFVPPPPPPPVESVPAASAVPSSPQPSSRLTERRKSIKIAAGGRVHSQAEIQAAVEKRNAQMGEAAKSVQQLFTPPTPQTPVTKLAQEYRKQNLDPSGPKVEQVYLDSGVPTIAAATAFATSSIASTLPSSPALSGGAAGRRASITATGTGSATVRRTSIAPGSAAAAAAAATPGSPAAASRATSTSTQSKPPVGRLDDDE